jgi:hypothetical protein
VISEILFQSLSARSFVVVRERPKEERQEGIRESTGEKNVLILGLCNVAVGVAEVINVK